MLKELEKRIDVIDMQVVELIRQREAVIRLVAEHKKEEGLPVVDPEREAAVLSRLATTAQQCEMNDELLITIYAEIFKHSRNLQQNIIFQEKA